MHRDLLADLTFRNKVSEKNFFFTKTNIFFNGFRSKVLWGETEKKKVKAKLTDREIVNKNLYTEIELEEIAFTR